MPEPIFVFGSNLAGIHGAGAARYAALLHGAIMGQGIGLQGDSCAIPTKDHQLRTLPLDCIEWYVSSFCTLAKWTPGIIYHVTQIGCGRAGLEPKDIAPMFKGAPENCKFSTAWSAWLPHLQTWTDA